MSRKISTGDQKYCVEGALVPKYREQIEDYSDLPIRKVKNKNQYREASIFFYFQTTKEKETGPRNGVNLVDHEVKVGIKLAMKLQNDY